jgi:DNA polymerase elongation subunit (family B)
MSVRFQLKSLSLTESARVVNERTNNRNTNFMVKELLKKRWVESTNPDLKSREKKGGQVLENTFGGWL